MKITTRRRERLKAVNFACPKTRNYPIMDKAHVSSAKAYYNRPYTIKCKAGKKRICARAKKFKMMTPEWEKWCR